MSSWNSAATTAHATPSVIATRWRAAMRRMRTMTLTETSRAGGGPSCTGPVRSAPADACGATGVFNTAFDQACGLPTSSDAAQQARVPGLAPPDKTTRGQAPRERRYPPELQLVQVRDRVLLGRHELEQRRPAGLRHLACPQERRLDLARLGDALRPATQRLVDVGVVAAQVARAEEVVRSFHVARLDGHAAVVEHHGENGNVRAHRGFEIEPRHAERRVAHEVHAELVRRSELRPHDEAEPGAELVRLAPADVAARRARAIRRAHLVARAARIVRDDGAVG